jgi:hypothetical protein
MTYKFQIMNELNLQNPEFLGNVIMIDVNNVRTLILILYDKKNHYLVSVNNVMDNYQVWQPLGIPRDLISFNDLKILRDE